MELVGLEAPLKDGVDYFDATPSIEACAEKIEQLHGFIEQQLLINGKLLLALKDVNSRLNELEEELGKPKSALILPERMQ